MLACRAIAEHDPPGADRTIAVLLVGAALNDPDIGWRVMDAIDDVHVFHGTGP